MLEHASLSDVGRQRDHNEDSIGVVSLLDGVLCVVADGMGGHAAGEVASAIALEEVERAARQIGLGRPAMPILEQAAARAHERIIETAKDGREGMGCTLTAVAIRTHRVEVLHIGDSRAYLIRDGAIEQITQDDTLVGELVRQGALTPEEARVHPHRNALLRALGYGETAEYQVHVEPAGARDVAVVCSDGLTTHVEDAEILRVVHESRTLKEAAATLVRLANEAGGSDNISVILCRCLGRRK